MLTQVGIISLIGISVVFGFLFLIFMLLKGLKYFASEAEPEIKESKIIKSKAVKSNVEEEIVVAITAALSDYITINDSSNIVIKKIGGN